MPFLLSNQSMEALKKLKALSRKITHWLIITFSALTLLVGRQEGHPTWKKTEWWGAGVVICLELGADLHTAQLMPLPLTVSCFSKIQTGFTFLVPAHQGSPGQRAVKWVYVCMYGSSLLYSPSDKGCRSHYISFLMLASIFDLSQPK